jgi:fluoroquinolone resistance protein
MAILQSGETYEDVNFERKKLDKTRIDSSTFANCRFVGCSLVAAVLQSCRFLHCSFTDCDLSLLELTGSEFVSVAFEGSKLVGVDWTRVQSNRPALGKPLSFTSSILNQSTFIGLDLREIKLTDCVVHEADFRESNLTGAVFNQTDLQGSLFMDTNLSSADFRSARNYHIEPTKNNIRGARFSMPEAISLLNALDIELDDDSYLL